MARGAFFKAVAATKVDSVPRQNTQSPSGLATKTKHGVVGGDSRTGVSDSVTASCRETPPPKGFITNWLAMPLSNTRGLDSFVGSVNTTGVANDTRLQRGIGNHGFSRAIRVTSDQLVRAFQPSPLLSVKNRLTKRIIIKLSYVYSPLLFIPLSAV